MEIDKEDYKFLLDNCGTDWDRHYGKELDDLIKRSKEIEAKYDLT